MDAHAPKTSGGSARDLSSPLTALIGLTMVVATVLPAFLTSSLAVQMREDFRLGDAALGGAVAASFAVATVTSAAAGRMTDRVGAVRAIHASVTLAFASSLAIALVVDSAGALIAALVLAGLANALAAPAVSALVSERTARRRRGAALGAQQAGAPAGALLAGLALPLLAVPLGWRWAFAAAALTPVAVALMMRSVRASGLASPPRPRVPRRDLGPVYLLALAAALGNVAANGMVAFLVVYAVGEGLAIGTAGFVLAATSLAAGASRIAFGALADARGGRTLVRVATLLAIGAAGYPLLATGEPVALVVGALIAGGIGWGWGGLLMLAIVEANPDAPGAAVGAGMIGIYAGASIGPFAVGLVAELTSFTVAWLGASALALLAAAVVMAAQRMQEARLPAGVARPR